MKSKKKKQPAKYVLTFVKPGEKKSLKLFRIVWTDHAVNRDSTGWVDLDRARVKTLEMVSVGFVVDENDESIALAQSVASNATVGDILTIVKSCIVSKVQL